MDSIDALRRHRDPSLLWKRIRPSWAAPLDTSDDSDPSLPRRPLANSYWATPTLLASEYPGDAKLDLAKMKLRALLDVGVREFIDLTGEGELRGYVAPLGEVCQEGGRGLELVVGDTPLPAPAAAANVVVRYRKFSVAKGGLPTPDCLRAILCALDKCAVDGRKAVVHCWAGRGRTGTIVACWLLHSGIVSGAEEALALLDKKWKGVERCWKAPTTPENEKQMGFVRDFAP